MSAVIHMLIWVAGSAILCLFSFILGRLPVLDTCAYRPWVMHRGYVPDPHRDSKAAVRRFRPPPPDMTPAWRTRS